MKTVRMIKLRLIFLDRTIVCTARPSRSLGRHGLVSGSATNVRDTVCRRLDLPLTSPNAMLHNCNTISTLLKCALRGDAPCIQRREHCKETVWELSWNTAVRIIDSMRDPCYFMLLSLHVPCCLRMNGYCTRIEYCLVNYLPLILSHFTLTLYESLSQSQCGINYHSAGVRS